MDLLDSLSGAVLPDWDSGAAAGMTEACTRARAEINYLVTRLAQRQEHAEVQWRGTAHDVFVHRCAQVARFTADISEDLARAEAAVNDGQAAYDTRRRRLVLAVVSPGAALVDVLVSR